MGARGFVTGEACLIPKTCLSIYEAEARGDYQTAKKILKQAGPLLDYILEAGDNLSDYIVKIKAGMNIVGLPGGIPRLPLSPADEVIKTKMKKLLDEYPLPELWKK